MYIVDNRVSDIIAGYRLIQAAEIELHRKWRPRINDVYAKECDLYDQNLAKFHKAQVDFRHRMRQGIWLSSALFILGLLVLPGLILINQLGDVPGLLVCFSPLLVLGGITGWAIIFVLWIWQRDQVKPVPPKNPVESGLFYSLLPLWKNGLLGVFPNKKPDPNQTGLIRFTARLQKLDLHSYAIYSYHLKPGDYVDLILVGTKGLWLFTVNYLDGLVRWRDGEWSHYPRRTKLFTRGDSSDKIKLPSYDVNWQTAAESVSSTIQEFALDLIEQEPQIAQVRGGIAFTHPKGRYDIPPGCPFNWGIIPFWLEKIESVPDIPGIDERGVITILDILLSQHNLHMKATNTRSMVDYANQISAEAEESMRIWITRHQIADQML